MSDDSLLLVRETLMMTLRIAAPILGAGVLVGLTVSVAQSITSIQDQSLSFVPKIFVMVIVAALLIPWIATKLIEYAAFLFTLV